MFLIPVRHSAILLRPDNIIWVKKNGSWISSDLILQLRTDALLKSLCLIHFFLCSQAYMRKEGFINLAHLHPVKKDHFGVTFPKCLSCGGLINVVLSDQKSLKMAVMYPVQWTKTDSQDKTVKSHSLFSILLSSKDCPQFSDSVCGCF